MKGFYMSEQVMLRNKSKVYQLPINYDVDQIMNFADCLKDNPNYDEYLELLNQVIEEKIDCILPIGYVLKEETDVYTPDDNQGVINCLVTIGDKVDEEIKGYFHNCDYLEGLFLTLLGDSILFQACNHLYNLIKEDFLLEHQYLSVRMEPGDIEIDVKVQGDIFNKIKDEFSLDMIITEGFMISPTKSLAYFYKIDDYDYGRGLDHSCLRCLNVDCKNRSLGCTKSNNFKAT